MACEVVRFEWHVPAKEALHAAREQVVRVCFDLESLEGLKWDQAGMRTPEIRKLGTWFNSGVHQAGLK